MDAKVVFFGTVGFARRVFVSLINATIGVHGVEVGFWYSRCKDAMDAVVAIRKY